MVICLNCTSDKIFIFEKLINSYKNRTNLGTIGFDKFGMFLENKQVTLLILF